MLRAAGFVLYLGFVRRAQPPAYPSIADAAWLASNALFVVGVSYVAWRQSPRATCTLVLDAVVGVFVTAGILVVLLFDTVAGLADAESRDLVLGTNLACPIPDLALLIVVVCVPMTGSSPRLTGMSASASGPVQDAPTSEAVTGLVGSGWWHARRPPPWTRVVDARLTMTTRQPTWHRRSGAVPPG